ncbi:MAG: WD40/YVTN/BNR-like repeat-containing protein [Blastocatellales bacterium]
MPLIRRRSALIIAMLVLCAGIFSAGAMQDEKRSPLDSLKFREIGPAMPGGRIDDFAVLESNPAVFYVATATGGLLKTTSNGATFEYLFDKETTSSIGDVAIAPNDANLVWVGTGENNNRQSSSWGDGIYKSTDGGRTWKNMGLRDSKHIARIIVDPVDHDVVYVAALGSLWGKGGERGVYKTTDGGLTWSRILHVDDDTGATELVQDPSNNKTLYAATYQRRRSVWGMNGGGPGSAIHKSTDAGRTWKKLSGGLPEGAMGRIGMDIFRRNSDIVYARIEHPKEGGVYRSEDAGASWKKMSATNPRPMYFSQIRVDPNNDLRIYVLGVQLLASDDGGKTWNTDAAKKIHVDFHALWINPNNSDHLILGGDGGVGISYDRSKTYVWLRNTNLGQFYHVTYDFKTPFTVCGGLQDNNTWCGPSAVRSSSGIGNDDWWIIGGGDGFVAQIDPTDPRIMYAESQDGRMNRVDRVTNERKPIRPEPAEGEKDYRWNWDTPMLISPHNPATVFVCANHVFKSTDRGHSWKVISPDLTTATDRDNLELMGVKGKDTTIARNDGVGSYGNIVSFAESPKKAGLYYAGSDDGVVSVSRDDGANWENVTSKIPGLPGGTYVSRLAPSKFDEGTVYATFDGHRMNDFGTWVFASRDHGRSWKSIAGSLPKGEVARTITEDLKNPDVLYLGTETGIYVSFDRGGQWTRLKANLPTVPVYEITLHPRDNAMLVATHGRGIWILDDLTPLQEYNRAVASDAHLFETTGGEMINPAGDKYRDFEGDMQFLGANPPIGVPITWHLKSKPKELAIEIKDPSGAVVRKVSGDALKDKLNAGIGTWVWDMRVEPLPAPRQPQGPGGGFFGGGGLDGPFVLPGQYSVVLKADGKELASRSFQVRGDREIIIADVDRKAMFDAAMDLHRLHGRHNEASTSVTALNERLRALQQALKNSKDAPQDLSKKLEDFAKRFTPTAQKFGINAGDPMQTGDFSVFRRMLRFRISGLKSGIMSSTSRPTETQMRQIPEVRAALETAINDANKLIAELPAIQKEMADKGIFPSEVKPIN